MKIQIHLAHKIEKAVTVWLLSDMVTFRNPLRSNSTVMVMYDYMATQQHKTNLTWNILGVVAEEKFSDLKSCCSGSYLLQ